jgi:hypothetical protein
MHGPSEGIFLVMSLMIPILADSLFVMMIVRAFSVGGRNMVEGGGFIQV